MLHRSVVVLVVGTVLFAAACGSSSNENGAGDGGGVGATNGGNGVPSLSNGTFTLTGAVTGSVPCSQATATWTPSANLTGINLGGASDEVGVLIGFNVHFQGTPAAKTYTYGDPGIDGAVTVGKGSTLWSTEFATTGTYTMTITSVGEPKKNALENLDYPVHGTARASIPPGASASGMIELDATF